MTSNALVYNVQKNQMEADPDAKEQGGYAFRHDGWFVRFPVSPGIDWSGTRRYTPRRSLVLHSSLHHLAAMLFARDALDRIEEI